MSDLQLLTGTQRPWMADAACTSTNPEAFHPDKGASAATAKAVCRGCPVTTECLTWALEHNETGVWGGTTDYDRRTIRIRQARRRAAA